MKYLPLIWIHYLYDFNFFYLQLKVNLSPALSNDCDTDRIVKKPMLHDMFDLLGLPIYNTGLSTLRLFSEDMDNSSEWVIYILTLFAVRYHLDDLRGSTYFCMLQVN